MLEFLLPCLMLYCLFKTNNKVKLLIAWFVLYFMPIFMMVYDREQFRNGFKYGRAYKHSQMVFWYFCDGSSVGFADIFGYIYCILFSKVGE